MALWSVSQQDFSRVSEGNSQEEMVVVRSSLDFQWLDFSGTLKTLGLWVIFTCFLPLS